jgi:hypothetical protein
MFIEDAALPLSAKSEILRISLFAEMIRAIAWL